MRWESPYCLPKSLSIGWRENGLAELKNQMGKTQEISRDLADMLTVFEKPSFPTPALRQLKKNSETCKDLTAEEFAESVDRLVDRCYLERLPFVVGRDLRDYEKGFSFEPITWMRHHIYLKYSGDCSVTIGNFCSISDGVTFILNAQHRMANVSTSAIYGIYKNKRGEYLEKSIYLDDASKYKKIVIKNDVWMGSGASVLGGVTIGNGAIIGANSHVIGDVPDYAILAGNPAKILRFRFSKRVIESLLKIEWWNWPADHLFTYTYQQNLQW